MSISINSNIAALRTQRMLAQSSRVLQTSYERLSSGQRINRGQDDAAGLSVASRLQTDARVYTQGIKNINDGVSALNIAEGSLTQLTSVTSRLRELAIQAANGSFGLAQRRSMDTEAFALTNEYNRIIETTRFNSLGLVNGSLSQFSIQAGYGNDGRLGFALGQNLKRTVGTGSFGAGVPAIMSGLDAVSFTISADFNNDGKADIVMVDDYNAAIEVSLGNGDGSFASGIAVTSPGVNLVYSGVAADVNNDGKQDLVLGSSATGAGEVYVYLGQGNGTFQSAKSFIGGTAARNTVVTFGDINGDSKLDMVTGYGSNIGVLLGNGNGTFAAKTIYAAGQLGGAVALGDINNDGKLDLISSQTDLAYRLGNGNGTFGTLVTVATGVGSSDSKLKLGDLNHDGYLDIVTGGDTGGGGIVRTFLGNGNASFRSAISYQTSGTSPTLLELSDTNADGYLDILITGTSTMNSLLNKGDGNFNSAVTSALLGGFFSVADFTGDGVTDVMSIAFDLFQIGELHTGASEQVTSVGRLNLLSQSDALSALGTIDTIMQRLSTELGVIGSNQSRLGIALNNLSEGRNRFIEAHGRIVNADVAEESAILIKNQILQQVASGVLSQANQLPSIALDLLKS